MLVLTHKVGDQVNIDGKIRVTVVAAVVKNIRLGSQDQLRSRSVETRFHLGNQAGPKQTEGEEHHEVPGV